MEKVLESLTNMIGKQSDGEKSNSKKSNETVLNNQLQSATQASVMTSLPSTLASMTSFQPRTLPNFGLPRLDLHQIQAAHQAALDNAGNNPNKDNFRSRNKISKIICHIICHIIWAFILFLK